jgi:hypothetical protein
MSHEQECSWRLILCGASNVARGIGTIAKVASNLSGTAVDIQAAMGHGRSYGLSTWAPCRRLPGILDCGIWNRLQTCNKLPSFTLITDIGNDLVYGCSPLQVIDWVQRVLDRVQPISQHILMTALPMESVRRVSQWNFQLFRRMLFPKSQLSLLVAKQHGEELHARVIELAKERGVELFYPHAQWYGFDPIHIRFLSQHRAWSELLSCLLKNFHFEQNFFSLSWHEHWRVLNMLPQLSLVKNKERYVTQPALVLRNGTRVSYY